MNVSNWFCYDNRSIILIPPSVNAVTITPAIITPADIAKRACLNLMPNTNAAAHPVHAPVTGSGIATNIVSAKVPYFSNLSECLWWVRVNSHEKNISPILKRRKYVDTGSRNRSSGITGSMFPMTARIYVSTGSIPYTPIAIGIAPLSSEMGVALNNIVESQCGTELKSSINCPSNGIFTPILVRNEREVLQAGSSRLHLR